MSGYVALLLCPENALVPLPFVAATENAYETLLTRPALMVVEVGGKPLGRDHDDHVREQDAI